MTEFAGLGGVYGADPDAVISLAAYVSREWSYGVRIVELVGLPQGGAIAACRHGDGSRWFVAGDRYAVAQVSGDSVEEVCAKLARALEANRVRLAERDRIVADIAEEDAAAEWLNARLVSTYGRGVESDAE